MLLKLSDIWSEEKVQLWLRPYEIIVTSQESGIIEPILNAVSLHQVCDVIIVLINSFIFQKCFVYLTILFFNNLS